MKILLSVLLLLINIIIISNDDCIYDTNYFGQDSGEAYKQKCFSLSYNENNNNYKCCYQATPQSCVKESSTGGGFECPTNSTIYNNCGMAGIFEPLNEETCTGISLVQGYCCYVKTDKGNACIRTKKLEKDVNTTTDQIDKHVKAINNEAKIIYVTCKGWNLQINKLLFVLISFFIIF